MLEIDPSKEIDISSWIKAAGNNPSLRRQREVTEVLLHAVARIPLLRDGLYLKGGVLMALGHDSIRNTGDIDFSSTEDPQDVELIIKSSFDDVLRRTAPLIGRLNLLCKVQRVRRKPRQDNFIDAKFPALEISIGSALKNDRGEMQKLDMGQSIHVVRVDLSFKEKIGSVHKLIIGSNDVISAYGIYDLVAEKIRAILQQKIRLHAGDRRQDVFDINGLLRNFSFDEHEKNLILRILVDKSESRDFSPDITMIDDEIIVSKLRRSWPSLQAELQDPLPDFDETFSVVRDFYRSLPWSSL